jgi:PAS domain S-box-containing protein
MEMTAAFDPLGARILVVDDAADAPAVEAMLREAGYSKVVAVHDPCEAAGRHAAEPFDLVVLDIVKPGIDGFAVIGQLRAAGHGHAPAILAVTADPAVIERALDGGARDFVARPLQAAEVVARVRNLLRAQASMGVLRERGGTLERRLGERTAELRESEEDFRLFAANMTVGMFIRGVERKTYRFVNAAFGKVTGQDAAPGDSIDKVLSNLHPEDEPVVRLHIQRTPEGLFERDMRFRHADGTHRWGHVHTFPMRDAGGRAAWIGGTIEDITERKLAEIALAEADSRFRALVEQSIVGIFVVDDGRFTYANPRMCSMFGVPVGGLTGRTTLEFIVESDRARLLENRRRALAGDEDVLATTYHIRRFDGESCQVAWDGRFIELEGRRVILGIAQDVTQRLTAQAAIVKANEQLKALSHRVLAAQEDERRSISRELHDDVGQSLIALRMGLHRLGGHVDAPLVPVLAQCLGVSRAILDRLHELSIDLLPPQLDELGLADALRWLVSRQRDLTGMSIVCRIGTSERLAAPVELACYRICQEALSNATRHARAHAIAVELDSDADQLIVSVRDDGQGFDEKEARDHGLAGGNLGLIGMRERAQLAGGRLEMRTGPMLGTTVSAFFSLAEDRA